jgi:hypothetical protein
VSGQGSLYCSHSEATPELTSISMEGRPTMKFCIARGYRENS